MSLHKIFVYGTLKRGEPNHNWITDSSKGFAQLIGLGKTVTKYPLIIATKYNIPFLLDSPGQGNNVVGELYEVDNPMLSNLDTLEEHPTFYTREIQEVKLLEDSTKVKCWIYLLKKFKPELLKQQQFVEYSSSGPHGLKYGERYLRQPSYNYKQDVA